MQPSAARLRRAVTVTTAVLVALFGALALLFGALLEPGEDLDGCSTGLHPGTYADAIVPAHLAAFAVLALLIAWLAGRRSTTGRPGRGTLAVLGAIAVFALAATARHQLMDWPGLVALLAVVPVGALLGLAALINTALVLRSGQPPQRGWERHARLAQIAAWLALVVGLPAMLAAVWTNVAGLFCF
jgi:lysylphosphatidylglycerol synthetase-like protein (DUF2156 family)